MTGHLIGMAMAINGLTNAGGLQSIESIAWVTVAGVARLHRHTLAWTTDCWRQQTLVDVCKKRLNRIMNN